MTINKSRNEKLILRCLSSVMKNFTAALFLIMLWQPQLQALNEQDQVLLKSVLKIALSADLPILPNKTLPLDQVASSLQKIANDSETLQKILTVRNALYTEEGEILRVILVAAAKSSTERDVLITAIQYERCKKWFWQCSIPSVSYDMLRFKLNTTLKGDIDALEERLIQIGVLEDNDLSDFKLRSLDEYEPYFKLFVRLEPLLGQLNSFLLEYYAQKSLRNLNKIELKEILEKLISFLNDNENGALGFIRKAQPRS